MPFKQPDDQTNELAQSCSHALNPVQGWPSNAPLTYVIAKGTSKIARLTCRHTRQALLTQLITCACNLKTIVLRCFSGLAALFA
eukprot:1159946-Pelagomonas_calceolata.AAC.12